MTPEPHESAPGERLSLSELMSRTDVPASTIHHYRRAGLTPPPTRVAGNRFCYDERHVEALLLIRLLRERRGMSLEQIAAELPALVRTRSAGEHGNGWSALVIEAADARARVIEAAIEAFRTRSYGEVTMSEVADAARVAKGSLYRHFANKEDLFAAVIETILSDTASRFAAAVDALGGPAGLAGDPQQAQLVFAELVAGALPILLELGARAAKGHDASEELARRVIRTLAEAAGAPLSDDPIRAGVDLLQAAFGTVLSWAVGPDWPPDEPAGRLDRTMSASPLGGGPQDGNA